MVTTSYEIPPIKELDSEAKDRGILILNELGEDPGMDHFATQMLLDDIKADGGKVLELHSYGSGLPSFKFNNNPMGYKFSWEPKGVFLAAQVPLGRAASSVAVGASKEKMRESGAQERETIAKGAEEQRLTARQAQEFSERDEERDRRQATQAYRY